MNLKMCNNLDELLKYARKDFKLFVDMDGVLANFDKHFEKLSGGSKPWEFLEDHSKNELWSIIKSDPRYFRDLEWMPDGQELWNAVKDFNPIILTSPAKDMEYCESDKKKWVEEKIGEDIEVIFSHSKGDYADTNSILIDDMDKNLIPWQEAGGIAIKHVDAETTISELKRIIGQK